MERANEQASSMHVMPRTPKTNRPTRSLGRTLARASELARGPTPPFLAHSLACLFQRASEQASTMH
eukprot:3308544-Pyramimonas_sp.AAC.1